MPKLPPTMHRYSLSTSYARNGTYPTYEFPSNSMIPPTYRDIVGGFRQRLKSFRYATDCNHDFDLC